MLRKINGLTKMDKKEIRKEEIRKTKVKEIQLRMEEDNGVKGIWKMKLGEKKKA